MKRTLPFILAMLISCVALSHAKPRIWTDRKGNSLEAELVNMIAGHVILKTPAGKVIKVPQSGLCSEDIEYLKNAIPPVIEVEVDISNKREWREKSGNSNSNRNNRDDSHTIYTEKVTGTVTIEKKNREPSSRKFTAFLYLFAENIDSKYLSVIDRTEYPFSFGTQSKATFSGAEGQTKHAEWSKKNSGGKSGYKYEGYLVIIEDENGEIIFTKGSRKLFEQNAPGIRKAGKDDVLTSSFTVRKPSREKK